ncbi:MAG: antibiotic biosynthesis monooxygenase [Saprospiraceae bacterium]|nr:antibiotic biosynthesis monooxygenase [Saprospiraceae bacterium]HRJ13779.1 antibiotic biosynthesis monooxygenase [Saprospiraceae bacterium]HRK82832.1 antibiotic biosynthesis monooxygenase [Saprospiraceae bacterium]
MLVKTPPPPYYAVIFSSLRADDDPAYHETALRMVELASNQPGFLGMESARNEVGITVSYWENEEAIRQWKRQTEHLDAQQSGRKSWYSAYAVRVCRVERAYEFG